MDSKRYLILSCGIISAVQAFGKNEEKFNVLFISADDMKPLLGCYGDPIAITPSLDGFAKEATLFTRAYCQQPVSGPSRASFLTGRYPDQTGVLRLSDWIRAKDPDIVTLPQAFREAGYTTAGVGKVFQTDRNNLDSLSWTIRPKLFDMSRTDQYLLDENKTDYKSVSNEFTSLPDSLYYDVKIREAATKTLRELAGSGKPFFLAVGFHKPHLPFNAPERYRDMYKLDLFEIDSTMTEGAPEIAYRPNRELTEYTDIPDLGPISPEQQKQLKRAYYAAASFTDDNIGIVLGELRKLGLWDKTVIVILGDHGYHLGEQRLWCKSTNFEQAFRAPLIIKQPFQKKGRVEKRVSEFAGIFPTVCELCGIEIPSGVSGHNLFKVNLFRRNYAFSQIPHTIKQEGKNVKYTGYSVRDRNWTYVAWFDKKGNCAFIELYKMKGHRIETKNLAGAHKHAERRLERALSRHLEEIGVL